MDFRKKRWISEKKGGFQEKKGGFQEKKVDFHLTLTGREKMPDSAFVPRSQQQCQESSKYILLPAKIQNSRYSIRTKPCKYFEIGQCLFGKKCRFFHDPRGPRTFEHEKFSKNLLHEIEKKFEKNHKNLKCILDKQTEEIISLKKLLIEKLDLLAHKTAENHSLEGKCPSPYDPDNKKNIAA